MSKPVPRVVENVAVRALATGYASGEVRKPGDVFGYSGPVGSWMEVLDGVKPPEPAKPKKPPEGPGIYDKPKSTLPKPE